MIVNGLEMYSSNGTKSVEDLVKEYGVLVKRIAHHLMGRLPASVQVEDLIQSGMIGLIEAAKNFDTSKGASFETYAGIRIRGSMLDEIRRGDWAPRSVHRNTRMIANAIKDIENQNKRDARDNEVAEYLKISLEQYHSMLQDTNGTKIFAYEDIGVTQDSFSEGMLGSIPGPLDGLQKENFKKTLASYVAKLPEKERLLLALYYDEELNLREIGEVLGVSESRVSQIHSQAMIRLQARMSEWKK